MFILIILAGFLAMAGVIAYLLNQRSKLTGQLWGADRDATRARAKMVAANKRLTDAQAEVQRLTAELSNSISNTGQAMAIGKHIAFVSQQLRELMAFIGPLADEGVSGRHAIPPNMPAGELAGELPVTYTCELPHIHADHWNGTTVAITNGAVPHINWEGTEEHGV
jgi:hypothetical protein